MILEEDTHDMGILARTHAHTRIEETHIDHSQNHGGQ
jgi:hypothetical protein